MLTFQKNKKKLNTMHNYVFAINIVKNDLGRVAKLRADLVIWSSAVRTNTKIPQIKHLNIHKNTSYGSLYKIILENYTPTSMFS